MIKIDVNGSEYQVLKGAHKTLEEYKPALLVEVAVGLEDEIFGYLKNLEYQHKALSKEKR